MKNIFNEKSDAHNYIELKIWKHFLCPGVNEAWSKNLGAIVPAREELVTNSQNTLFIHDQQEGQSTLYGA